MAAAAPTATAEALMLAWVVIAMAAGEIVAEETAAVEEISGTQRLTNR
jgi:tellurite resistance protein